MTTKHRLNTILPLAAAAMASLVLTTASAHAGLVTHYKLDETSGTDAIDATGNGNDGTVVSPTWEVDTTGLTDPTSTTGVSMTSGNLLSGLTGLGPLDDTFTIMFWLQSDDFVDDTFARFFSIGNDTGGQSEAIFAFVKEIEFGEDQVEVVYYPLVPDGASEATLFQITPNPLTTGWHHHAAVVDGLNLSYYIDGTLRDSGSLAVGETLTNSEFYILGSPTQGDDKVSGSIDEVGVFDEALDATAILGFMTNGLEGTTSGPSISITSITSLGSGNWELTLKGEPDTVYEFRSSTTLVFTPGALVVSLTQNDETNDPGTVTDSNLLTTDSNGDGTVRMTLTGPENFVRAQIPPPVTVFSENFDEITAPNLPTDWTTNTPDPATTLWELGSPTVVGPSAANSGANCVGTDLDANYGLSSDIWLRTPSTPGIDLTTATGATLTFQHWVDIDPFETAGVIGDKGTVRVLKASDLSFLETLGADISGLSPAGWVEFSADFTTASLGNSVVLEFVFVSDGDDDDGKQVSSGWYIDDVMVTVP